MVDSCLYVYGYRGKFGAEKANLALARDLSIRGVSIDFVIDHQTKFLDPAHLQEFGRQFSSYFGSDLLSFKPSFVELTANVAGVISSAFVAAKIFASKRGGRYDMVIFPNYIQLIIGLPFLVLGRKVAMRVGDVPDLSRSHHGLFWRMIDRFVDIYLPNSPLSLERLSTFSDAEKSLLTPNHIKVSHVSSPFVRSCKEDLKFGYLGQFTREKGVLDLIQFASYSGAYLTVKGNVDRDTYPDDLATVSFLDYSGDLEGFFTEIDFLVVFSLFDDSSPNVIFESIASGVPVVTSKSVGISEWIKEFGVGLVIDSIDDLSDLTRANHVGVMNGFIERVQQLSRYAEEQRLSSITKLLEQ